MLCIPNFKEYFFQQLSTIIFLFSPSSVDFFLFFLLRLLERELEFLLPNGTDGLSVVQKTGERK